MYRAEGLSSDGPPAQPRGLLHCGVSQGRPTEGIVTASEVASGCARIVPTSWWLEALERRAVRMHAEYVDLARPIEFASENGAARRARSSTSALPEQKNRGCVRLTSWPMKWPLGTPVTAAVLRL